MARSWKTEQFIARTERVMYELLETLSSTDREVRSRLSEFNLRLDSLERSITCVSCVEDCGTMGDETKGNANSSCTTFPRVCSSAEC